MALSLEEKRREGTIPLDLDILAREGIGSGEDIIDMGVEEEEELVAERGLIDEEVVLRGA